MTSIHIDTQMGATNGAGLNQTQPPSKYDEVERVRQRMDGLRKHHNESADIYNRAQPIINDQIHEETMKYLKSGQVNGTKTKSQKPRAPKKQRNTSSGTSSTSNASNPALAQTNSIVTSTTNGIPSQAQPMQPAPPLPPQSMIQQPQGHIQQITLYPPRIQPQQTIHMQPQHLQHQHQMPPQQQQQHFKYQATNGMYAQQPTMQPNQIQYQAQQQPQQQIYSQQQQMQQPPSHIHPQQIEQNHFVAQHQAGRQSQHFAQHHNHPNGNHHTSHHPHHPHTHMGHLPLISLPNDLDLTLQAGLECVDVDSLIKHEMSVEGQLEFNHDLLLKLDNHYPQHYQ